MGRPIQVDPVCFLIVGAVIIGLCVYCYRLNELLVGYRTDYNDIFDRIRFWRKGGCDNDKGFWLLGDIAGIAARRMGYNHATVQRQPDSEDSVE